MRPDRRLPPRPARPVQVKPKDHDQLARVENGEKQFAAVGCADCHSPNLGSIAGFYSNLLLHDMGPELASSTGYYGPPPAAPSSGSLGTPLAVANEWRTPPLWGVCDSGPYLHDGRAETLEAAILRHAGEASGVTESYKQLTSKDQEDIVLFLKTLRAPGMPETSTTVAASGR